MGVRAWPPRPRGRDPPERGGAPLGPMMAILTLYSRHASKRGGHLLAVAFLLLALLKVLLVVAFLAVKFFSQLPFSSWLCG